MTKPRGILIAGNWKMNHGPVETERFFAELLEKAGKAVPSPEAFQRGLIRASLFPPCVSLAKASSLRNKFPFPIAIGAQNTHWELKGAFTGEISGPMLQEMGIHWVLVGHSERRQYFGETDATVLKRAESLLNQGFRVILCVGETQKERESGKTEEVLTRQITEGVPLAISGSGELIVAYEPVWAIGTGLTATAEQADQAHGLIRQLLLKKLGPQIGERTPLLYGGSVNSDNIKSLLSCSQIDGALVGGASLKAESFLNLIHAGLSLL